MSRRTTIALLCLAAAAALAVVLTATLGGSSKRAASTAAGGSEATTSSGFDGAVLPPKPRAPAFTLTDVDGRSVSLSDFHGRVTVLTFLYSTCGPTCILIAQQIRGALDELETQHAPRPAVAIVSADPRADTPASVARFLAETGLSGRVDYLTGPLHALRAVWRAYRVTPASVSAETFRRYAFLLLLDGEGRERVLFEPEVLTPESVSHDILKLQAG